MTPAQARSYLKMCIETQTGQQAIRKAFPQDAVTLIDTRGDAYTDDAVVEVANKIAQTLVQSYNL